MKKKFIEFLRNEGVVIDFMVYLLCRKNYKSLNDYLNHCSTPYTYVGSGFSWSDTTEGSMFWWNISDKWKNTIDS